MKGPVWRDSKGKLTTERPARGTLVIRIGQPVPDDVEKQLNKKSKKA